MFISLNKVIIILFLLFTGVDLSLCVVGAGYGDGLLTGKPWTLHCSSSLFVPLWNMYGLVAVACKTLMVLVFLGYSVYCF